MIDQAVILCGGEGTRLGDSLRFTPAVEIPKPLMEVGGLPFVKYSINMLEGIGFKDIILMVLHKKEMFSDCINGDTVRLELSRASLNEAVLSVPGLKDLFLLLNGDCYPVMDWRDFCNTDKPRTAIKVVGRDAGCAVVSKEMLEQGEVSCSDIKGMGEVIETYIIEGGLHIGTPQGLQRARQYMDIVVYGQ